MEDYVHAFEGGIQAGRAVQVSVDPFHSSAFEIADRTLTPAQPSHRPPPTECLPRDLASEKPGGAKDQSARQESRRGRAGEKVSPRRPGSRA